MIKNQVVLRINKNKKIKQTSNYVLIKIFMLFFIMALLVSATMRTINIIENSEFNVDYFNILLIGKDVYYLNINKNLSQISVLKFENVDKKILNFSKDTLGVYFGIPIDAVVKYSNSNPLNINDFFSFSNLYNLSYFPSKNRIGFSRFDILKAFIYCNILNSFEYNIQSYNLKNNNKDTLNQTIYNLFKNNRIINDKVSIEVINASDVSGAATKFSQMLKNIGFNVIAVRSSGENSSSKAIIRLDKNNYSALVLEKYLDMSFEFRNEISISDITIIIGNDYASKIIFPSLNTASNN